MFTNKLINDSLAEAVKKVMKDEESGLRMAAHAAHKSGKKMFTFQGKTYPVKVQGEEVSFGEAIEEAKDCVTEPRAKEIAKKEVKSHETQHHGSKGDVAKHVKKMHKEETFKDRLIESAYGKKSPMIDEDDSEMTPEQKKKKEKIVLSMKDREKQFKAKYGKNWKSVMYATATKLAMKEEFDPEDLEEAKGETEKEFKARQARLAAAHDATKQNPERLKRLMKIPGYGAAMSLAQKTTKEEVEQVQEGEPAYYKGKSTTGNALPPPGSFADRKRTGDTFLKGFKSNPQPIKPYVAPKSKNEEVEQIDEISKKTLGSYVNKASVDIARSGVTKGMLTHQSNKEIMSKRIEKRAKGIKMATKKLTGEETEQIDEVGDTEEGRQALTKLIGARVQDPKGKHGLEGVKRALKRLGPARKLRGEEVEELDEKNKSHTHAAHYENEKGEWVGMNLLVAKDDDDAIRQAHEKCKEGCRLSRVERHIPVKESTDDDVPFVPDKKKSSANVTDKSGAHHTAMSRVRHLAKQALEKQKKMKKEMIGKAGMTSEETNEE
jgi:hypothetical protein